VLVGDLMFEDWRSNWFDVFRAMVLPLSACLSALEEAFYSG